MSRLTKYDHLPEFVRRRVCPGNYPVAREHPSRQLLEVQAIIKKLDPAEIRQPTWLEIADVAVELATDDWPWLHSKPDIVEVFYRPPWLPLRHDSRSLYLPWINEFREEAEKQLRRHYAYHHVYAMRCQRWRRAHPRPRGWAWTRQPLKHAIPPPRKRIYRPPGEEYPDSVSPPVPTHPACSSNRPGWREKEILLCYDWLFGNEIVVRPYTDGLAKLCEPALQRAERPVAPFDMKLG